jgi:hypothetical protein
MKAYLLTTGTVFGLLTLVHIWRAIVESTLRDPAFMLITVLSAALCIWAIRLLRIEARGRS